MTFALWTLIAAAVLPYLCAAAAKSGRSGYDNAAPRASMQRLSGWRARADGAQRNHFEAFPAFAAAVLTAQFVNAPQGRIDRLAGLFVLVRLAYTLAYLAGWPTIRSLVWAVGFVLVLMLFTAGVW